LADQIVHLTKEIIQHIATANDNFFWKESYLIWMLQNVASTSANNV